MNIMIRPGKLNGEVQVPPSKSYAHRMLICAALAEGKSVLSGIASSEDISATLDCIGALGAECAREKDCVTVKKNLRRESLFLRTGMQLPVFPCRESGSTLRFLIPVSLAVCGGGVFTGTTRLIERGIGVFEELFEGSGITIDKARDSLTVKGVLSSGCYRLRGDVSSQFVTGMMFALSLLEEDSTIEVLPPVESRAYIDITTDVMSRFGVAVREERRNVFFIPGGQRYQARKCQVEGDWSNAAFLYAFNAVGGSLKIQGLNERSIQGDRACVTFFKQLAGKCPEREQPIDLSDTPDLGPVLFATAAALKGGFFTGTGRLRIKESDRASVMAEELQKFGVRCIVRKNEVVVLPSMLRKPQVPLNGHNDHRVVMALTIPASLTGGTITGAEAVKKSWPEFFETMQQRGLQIEDS